MPDEVVSFDLGHWIRMGWWGFDGRNERGLPAVNRSSGWLKPWMVARSSLERAVKALEATKKRGESTGRKRG